MSSACAQQTAANTFIDLATFSELEGFAYGGPDAISWFVGAVCKSNWFSFIPVKLRHTGVLDFGQQNVAANVNRSGDYVLNIWFRAQIPQLQLNDPGANHANATIRWTRHLMHNLFEKISITFNELCVQEFDNYWLDFNFQLRLRGSKRVGYRNMIGDVASFTTPVGVGAPLGTGGFLQLPIPFFFGEDSGVALPVAALPFNDIKVNYCFRPLAQLLVSDNGAGAGAAVLASEVVAVDGGAVALRTPETYAHYAVVHNDERVKMGDAPRDILIHQVQNAQYAPINNLATPSTFDIRLSHSIVSIAFGAQNVSYLNSAQGLTGSPFVGEWSNYTTLPGAGNSGLDPISSSSLVYENTCRANMGSDYFSLTAPFYWSTAIPDETGYHFYSYALNPWEPLKPSASTNYSKLANVSITHTMSPAAISSAATPPLSPTGAVIQIRDNGGLLVNFPQSYRHVFLARNWNIIRVANGSLGHPVL